MDSIKFSAKSLDKDNKVQKSKGKVMDYFQI